LSSRPNPSRPTSASTAITTRKVRALIGEKG
jgi:hypothetical protein